MKTTILTSIFLLITFISFSQVTYSKDVFGNTVAKDQYGNVISTYSKDVFGNTVEKDQYGNTKSTQSKDVFGNTVEKDRYGNTQATYSKDVFGNTVQKDSYGNTESTLTAPKTYAGRHQSICNKCRFAKDNHFALQMRRNILSLLLIFG
jgi:hypothetical protein